MLEKKNLILTADKIKDDIKHYQNESFLGDILNFIIAAKKEKSTKEEQLQRFFSYLQKCYEKPAILGGGKNKKDSFKRFVSDYLGLKKENGMLFLLKEPFKDWEIDQFFYVFAWLRRITKV